MAEALEDIRNFIASHVREGFESAHDIIENATHYAYETHDREDLQSDIKRITFELVAAHLADQSEWEPSTDCDRLNEAFSALNQQGIVARQNFACCNNCGFSEIWDEVDEAEKQHPVDGYVFYHLQCTDQAIQSGRLLMAYGCVEDDHEAFLRVANKIVAELCRVGLNASWGGTDCDPIMVDGIVWRRRR